VSTRDALRSIVTVHSSIPDDSFTAPILGTERGGSGVIIDDSGLVLTIGYLITEAESVWMTTADGGLVPGYAQAYDQETGFGLIQGMARMEGPAISFGNSSRAKPGDLVTLAGAKSGQAGESRIVARQEFAGYWEYLLDDAIFTAPAYQHWGGAGLIDAEGKLIGIGSLLLQAAGPEGVRDINMVVPIDLLKPVLDDLVKFGRINKPARPWLGVYSSEADGSVLAVNVDPRGPAAAAGLRDGDIISDIRDHAVESLADFYRSLWASGPAGTEIPLRAIRDGRDIWLRVKSADRNDFLKKPVLQ
jgi:S1-C subfamily serine protease